MKPKVNPWEIRISVPANIGRPQACLHRENRANPFECWDDTPDKFYTKFTDLQQESHDDPNFEGILGAFLTFGTDRGYLTLTASSKGRKRRLVKRQQDQ